jgi:D-glycerate 3-kinase
MKNQLINMTTDQLIQAFKAQHKLTSSIESYAPNWFIPIAELINTHQKRESKCIFVGLNGSQGSGKSTLADFIKMYLESQHQLSVAVISLDDFYLSQQKRNHLADTVHPLLKSRGVPGTHNTQLMSSTLHALKSDKPNCRLPRFNKAIDDPEPEENWPLVTEKVDVVVMEGWCWGTPEQTEQELVKPINTLESEEDKNGTWRKYVNDALKSDYLALYQQMDFWLMLKAPSFDCISNWRKEQEHKLRQAHALSADKNAPSAIMSDGQVERFIQHFQRLTEHGLKQVPEVCDLVLQLDSQRQPMLVSGSSVDEFDSIKATIKNKAI